MLLVCALALLPSRPRTAGVDYLVYVASEAADRIALVRFGAAGGTIEREFSTGVMPTDIDGPHGLAVSPDGRFFYVSIAHGQPFGALWKYPSDGSGPLARVTLGSFPATLQVSPGGDFAYVVNFNLHGDRVPSSVSVVETSTMSEIRRIPTCTMPHGSRFDPSGAKHYSACMMDDTLVEIDTATLRVSRHFVATSGHERGSPGSPGPRPAATAGGHEGHDGHGADGGRPPSKACAPTWAQPSADGRAVLLACNGSNELVAVDVRSWSVAWRAPAPDGVYNLAAAADGRILSTNRRDQSASIFDAGGKELTRVRLPRKAPHGIVMSPDQRYAFVSIEGMGPEPGAVVMIDVAAGRIAAAVDVAPQAGGIDFWKTVPSR